MTTRQKFENFHKNHPEVYSELVKICRDFKSYRDKWSIWAAFNILRWQRVISGLPDTTEDFKLSNNYTGYYSRLIMTQEPDLIDFFNTKPLKKS